METSTFSLKNLFTRGTESQLVVQQEQQPKRGFYKREENRDLEIISQLDEAILQCTRHVDRYNNQIAELSAEIVALKTQHQKLKSKTGAQANELLVRATKLMQQRAALTKRSASYDQQRLTLSAQVENHRNVIEAEAMNILLKESTIRMQGSMASLDLSSVKDTASGARLASNQASNMTAILFNPFEITPEDENAAFLEEFNALEINPEEEIEDVAEQVVLPPVPRKQQSVATVKPNAILLEDELF